jgi:hypothetical protein
MSRRSHPRTIWLLIESVTAMLQSDLPAHTPAVDR